MIILSGAKNIAPQHVESVLRVSPYISDAMVFGDRRPHLVALLTLERSEVERFADSIALATDSWSRMVRDPRVEQLVAAEVERCNQRLARYEQVRVYKILPRELSVEGGTLTPTFKVRRRAIEERYRPLIEGMYGAA
jgi:long-chain acyl-CoA synthetase